MIPDVRPLEPGDSDRLARMFGRLSRQSIYRRFFTPFPEPPDWLLALLTDVDHDAREALVATVGDEVVAEARYARDAMDPSRAEVAVLVEDGWQRRGVASQLLKRLARLGRERGIENFSASVMADNTAVVGLARSLAPERRSRFDDGYLDMEIPLPRSA